MPSRNSITLTLADVVYDLHDKLKSSTRGYGTMDYELLGYQPQVDFREGLRRTVEWYRASS